ncbi:family 16 glycosylhydrolase [Halodurantibacterium flavum]|uniref:Family 16 glycosylhydrolase n=1 Tax=Halodurantibacterium flavum TaxID=1382802 RepID=A0ABW4S6G3_9RHOB
MTPTPALDLYRAGDDLPPDGWLISDWPAGQSSILHWAADHVRLTGQGSVELSLTAAPSGSRYAVLGGEVQSARAAITGTWGWTVQAPQMVPGAVFGLFTYRADWENQPWVEFDFEFVGADTTSVRLNIHMTNKAGEHVTLERSGQHPVRVALGFDAATGVHRYEVTVSPDMAVFRIDGRVVGSFGPADMPDGIWTLGPMRSFVNLWAVAPEQEPWAGTWADPGRPLIATIIAADIRPSEGDAPLA